LVHFEPIPDGARAGDTAILNINSTINLPSGHRQAFSKAAGLSEVEES
jgi:hypothetical protein